MNASAISQGLREIAGGILKIAAELEKPNRMTPEMAENIMRDFQSGHSLRKTAALNGTTLGRVRGVLARAPQQ